MPSRMSPAMMLFALAIIAGAFAVLIVISAVVSEYKSNKKHKREIKQQEKENLKALFEDEDL